MAIQIVEKSGQGLSRVYGVKVPANDLGAKLDARIAELAPQMRIKGFRPGKVPQAHVRRLYGKSLMSEVVEQTLNESSQKVLDDNNLRAASQPDLTPESDMEQVLEGKSDLAYEMAIEVMPGRPRLRVSLTIAAQARCGAKASLPRTTSASLDSTSVAVEVSA